MAKRRKVGNLLALPVLSVLMMKAMHPYEIANALRDTGKDESMDIKWGSLYTVVQNLERHGFIEATETVRQGRRPERTVYRITEAGREELRDWVREIVGTPEREFPRLEIALSVLGVLPPDEAVALLDQRVRQLDAGIAATREMLAEAGATVPRIFLIESEYSIAIRQAEADWVRGLLKEIVDETMPGVAEWREFHRTGTLPADWRDPTDK